MFGKVSCFQVKFFGSYANILFRFLLETLPFATRFNPDPVGFLIEVKFLKVSKIVTMLLGNLGKLTSFVVKSVEIHPTFFHKLRFQNPSVSMFMSIDVLFSKKFCGLNENWD